MLSDFAPLDQCIDKINSLEISEKYNNFAKVSDEVLLSLLESSDGYITRQIKLGKILSDGLINISKSRKNGAMINSPDNVRDDFDACLSVEHIENSVKYDIFEVEGDSILFVSGMPPPALRKAQKSFRQAVDVILELVSIIQDIQSNTVEMKVE